MRILKDLAEAPSETRRNLMRRVATMAFFDILIAVILFASAGTLEWFYGWLYTALFILVQLAGAFFVPLDVLAERGSRKKNPEKWDSVVTTLILPAFLGVYLISGFDLRWGWSGGMATIWHLVGVLIFLLGSALEMWAMYANHFFSSAVRLQFERGHVVCDSGPYKYVRHPGYVGISLYYLFTPFFLGSYWALIPALTTALLLVIRTGLEDRTLQNKLPGYKEYAARVRYRLVPGIW